MGLWREFGTKLARSYSNILFLHSTGAGYVSLAATFMVPHVGLYGLIAGIIAMIIAPRYLRVLPKDLESPYIFNPILTGLLTGYFGGLTVLSVIMLVAFTIMAVVVTQLIKANLEPRGLPVMSLPFSFCGVLVVSATRGLNLFNPSYYYKPLIDINPELLPDAMARFAKFLGLIVLSPSVVSGAILLGVILVQSRILVIFAILGHSIGMGLDQIVWHGQVPPASLNLSFNLILISMALGAALTVPSLKSLLLAVLGVISVYFLNYALGHLINRFDVPLPFNVVSLSVLYSLKLAKSPLLPTVYGSTPEKTLWANSNLWAQERDQNPIVGLPVMGRWSIYQGFSGQWTHKQPWAHALDFVVVDDQGRSYRNDGCELSDYHCFKRPVHAPISGYIRAKYTSAKDNALGEVDKERNWGNYILIQSALGHFVMLGHLAEESIRGEIGEWVEEGQIIGACGNTGYSPEPHLHMQVQALPALGSPTIPFKLAVYQSRSEVQFRAIPSESEPVETLDVNVGLSKLFNFVLDQKMVFESRHTRDGGSLEIKVGMEAYSDIFYLADPLGARLYFVKHGPVFYFTTFWGDLKSPLRALFAALPCLPLTFGSRKTWRAHLPLPIRFRGPMLALNTVRAAFGMELNRPAEYEVDPTGMTVTGRTFFDNKACNSSCEIDPVHGIIKFECGDISYKRIIDNLNLSGDRHEIQCQAA